MSKITSKKNVFLFSALLLLGSVKISAAQVNLGVNGIDPKPGSPGSSKGPIEVPFLDLEGDVLTFDIGHDDYTLCILDENDNIVYSSYVPTSVTTVILPSTLSGSYELRLLTGSTYYFFGNVFLF